MDALRSILALTELDLEKRAALEEALSMEGTFGAQVHLRKSPATIEWE